MAAVIVSSGRKLSSVHTIKIDIVGEVVSRVVSVRNTVQLM